MTIEILPRIHSTTIKNNYICDGTQRKQSCQKPGHPNFLWYAHATSNDFIYFRVVTKVCWSTRRLACMQLEVSIAEQLLTGNPLNYCPRQGRWHPELHRNFNNYFPNDNSKLVTLLKIYKSTKTRKSSQSKQLTQPKPKQSDSPSFWIGNY